MACAIIPVKRTWLVSRWLAFCFIFVRPAGILHQHNRCREPIRDRINGGRQQAKSVTAALVRRVLPKTSTFDGGFTLGAGICHRGSAPTSGVGVIDAGLALQ